MAPVADLGGALKHSRRAHKYVWPTLAIKKMCKGLKFFTDINPIELTLTCGQFKL